MRLLAVLALLFVALPVAELALLLRVGSLVGLWPTLGIVLLTGVAGAALARSQGFRVLSAVQSELAQGRLPGAALLDGACVLAGGVLLLTPGFLTDAFGFLLLLPPTRGLLAGAVRKGFEQGVARGTIRVSVGGPGGPFGPGRPFGPGGTGGPWGTGRAPGAETIVDAEVVDTRPGPPG